jgi:hypothetical protein
MNIVRSEDLGAHTGGRLVWIDLRRLPILLGCALVVFALLFELGHLTRSTHAVPEASSAPRVLPAQFVRAGIPAGLNGASAIPTYGTLKAHSSPPPESHAPPAASPTPAATTPVVSATPSTPAPAPTAVAPAPVQHTSAPAPATHSESSGGGGSFDSSE